jgi:hypothetical protein
VASDRPHDDLSKIDVEREALTSLPLSLDAGAGGRATVIADEPGRPTIGVECTGRCLLVLTDRWERGWRVEVDGAPRELVVANGEFLACPVAPHDRAVQFLFDPIELKWGKIVSVLAATALGCALVIGVGASMLSRLRRPQEPAR